MSSRKHKTSSQQAAHAHNGSGHICVNINETERHASLIGGTVLAVCGLLRGSISGLALAAIGGALIYRGHTGHCHMYEALGHSSAEEGQETGKLTQAKRAGREHEQLQGSN